MDHIQWLLGYVLPFLFVLGIVVVVHELGHFWAARWCGVDVKAFSLGFGPELIGWTDRRGTRWMLAPIPLGGYVRFLGDGDATSTTTDSAAVGELTAAERSRTLQAQSIGARAFIAAAGPLANFVMAILVFTVLVYFTGRQIEVPRVGAVTPGSAAEAAGFKPGDLILTIDGQPIEGFADVVRVVSQSPEQRLAIMVERGGQTVKLEATPRLHTEKTRFGTRRIGQLGIGASREASNVRVETYGIGRSLVFGLEETWFIVDRTGAYVAGLFAGKEYADNISGPIRIATISGMVAKGDRGLAGLMWLAAILSVSIGLVNLVPVPMLDGGHLLFYFLEWVRGRPLSERVQELGFKFGLALVVMLMVFATTNDLRFLAW